MEFELEEWLIGDDEPSIQIEPSAPTIPRPAATPAKPPRVAQWGVWIPEESSGVDPPDLRAALHPAC